MTSKILKGLAIAAGAGLAIGLGSKKRRRATPKGAPASDSILTLEPLLDRLERVETRMNEVEARQMPVADSLSLAELDQRIQRQAKDIETLQIQVSETRQRVAAEVTAVEGRFAEVAREVPVILESVIAPRVEDLRVRLQAEMRESVEATLTTFEQTIDSKVTLRISTLEKALLDQSGIIRNLSEREADSDANLQRLISAVERLCERTDARHPAARVPATPPKDPSFLDLPFDRHDKLRPRTPMTIL